MSDERDWIAQGRNIGKKAEAQSDPTQTSAIVPETAGVQPWDLEHEGIFLEESGDKYFEVHVDPEKQQTVARMLKGIVNVSDIVSTVHHGDHPTDKTFYSREMPLQRVQQETPWPEVVADVFIFKYIFGDRDHYNSEGGPSEGGLHISGASKSHSNFRRGNERTAYFDFDGDFYHDDIHFDIHEYRKSASSLKPESLEALARKIKLLRERFDSKEGREFLSAIITKTGKSAFELFGAPPQRIVPKPTPEGEFENFYQELMFRLQMAEQAVSQELNKRNRP